MFKSKLVNLSPAGARVSKIYNGSENLFSMQRVLTSTEINYNPQISSAKIQTPKYSDTKFFEYRKFYDLEKLRSLYNGNNSAFLVHKRELRAYYLLNKDKTTIFRPVLDFNEIPNKKDINALIDLALESGYHIIAIPDSFFLNEDNYKKIILNAEKYADDLKNLGFEKIEIMPSANVKNKFDLFSKKLNLTKENSFNFINIENEYYIKHYANYSSLKKFSARAENIGIYGSNIPRLHKADWKTSGIHLYASFGQDILSQGNIKPFLKKDKKSVHDNPKGKLRFFDSSQDALIKRGEYNDKYGEELIYDGTPYCGGESLSSFCNKYNNQMLAMILKVIEFYATSKTLGFERDAVLKGEYQDIMKKKGNIGKLIESCSQRTLNF